MKKIIDGDVKTVKDAKQHKEKATEKTVRKEQNTEENIIQKIENALQKKEETILFQTEVLLEKGKTDKKQQQQVIIADSAFHAVVMLQQRGSTKYIYVCRHSLTLFKT